MQLNKFHGRKQASLIYKDQLVLRCDAADLVDLEEVVRRITLFLTEETFAKLPPDEG